MQGQLANKNEPRTDISSEWRGTRLRDISSKKNRQATEHTDLTNTHSSPFHANGESYDYSYDNWGK